MGLRLYCIQFMQIKVILYRVVCRNLKVIILFLLKDDFNIGRMSVIKGLVVFFVQEQVGINIIFFGCIEYMYKYQILFMDIFISDFNINFKLNFFLYGCLLGEIIYERYSIEYQICYEFLDSNKIVCMFWLWK